jgi:hypothetical protein
MADPSVIRKRLWSGDTVAPQDIGTALRDIDAKVSSIPQLKKVEMDAPYTEPMFVVLDQNPIGGLICTRIRDANNLGQNIALTGGMVHWQWDGARAQIDSIDGMSVGSGSIYRFTFLAVF